MSLSDATELRELFKSFTTPWGIEVSLDSMVVSPVSHMAVRVFWREFERQLFAAGFKPAAEGAARTLEGRPELPEGYALPDDDLDYDRPFSDLWQRIANTAVWDCPSVTHLVKEVLESECFHIGAFEDKYGVFSSLNEFTEKASDEMVEFMIAAISDMLQAKVSRYAAIAADLAKDTCWASDISASVKVRLGTIHRATFVAIDTLHMECYTALARFIRKVTPAIIGAYVGKLLPFEIKRKTPEASVPNYTVKLTLVIRQDAEYLPQFSLAYSELQAAFRSIDLLSYSLFPTFYHASELDVDEWCTKEDWDDYFEDEAVDEDEYEDEDEDE